jgi:hypothetical protein
MKAFLIVSHFELKRDDLGGSLGMAPVFLYWRSSCESPLVQLTMCRIWYLSPGRMENIRDIAGEIR